MPDDRLWQERELIRQFAAELLNPNGSRSGSSRRRGQHMVSDSELRQAAHAARGMLQAEVSAAASAKAGWAVAPLPPTPPSGRSRLARVGTLPRGDAGGRATGVLLPASPLHVALFEHGRSPSRAKVMPTTRPSNGGVDAPGRSAAAMATPTKPWTKPPSLQEIGSPAHPDTPNTRVPRLH